MIAKKISPKAVVKKIKSKTSKPETIEAKAGVAEKGKKTYNVLRGMKDILPREERYWSRMYQTAQDLAKHFQFGKIETPVIEETSLFVRSIGRGTDVVDKEMYVFEDKDGTKVCLRPENTAAIVRSYIGNGMWNQSQPVKLWYWSPMFRHDRPQAGRYRQFWQLGLESVGSSEPVVDGEMILVAYNFYKEIGLPITVRINSIGVLEERQRYKTELVNYYRSKRSYLCEDCKARVNRNPLRLLDCKEPGCQPVKESAPQIIDFLGPESKNHFMKVLEYLEELDIPYVLDHTLVRGLDYYTHTVFEFFPDIGEEEKAQSALGGGGRYDLLVEELGGRPTPACGVALAVDRSVAAWRAYLEKNNSDLSREKVDSFVAQLGEEARRSALRIVNDLRGSGIKLGYNFSKGSLKGQMELADTAKVPYVLIIGQKEVQDKTVIVRDMESGIQEIVDQKKVQPLLKRKLGIS